MTDPNEKILQAARDKFKLAAERENDNRLTGMEDLRFARLGEQWPDTVRKQREDTGRPCLTINRLPSFIRQVVNDARLNKPAINVHPSDSGADKETADIISGLIRNIETQSDADTAYDTAFEAAVTNGFGYFRINTAYTSEDVFDQDIVIERIPNPFTVYGDPYSTAADSSDWDCAFVTSIIPKDEFAEKYKNAEAVNWDSLGYSGLDDPWFDGNTVLVAEYWLRTNEETQIVKLTNGAVVNLDEYLEQEEQFAFDGITVVGEPRTTKRKKVVQHIITGAEVLESIEWPGQYIPIIPVYGDEINVEGRRVLRSLIYDAKDPQRMLNYWRTVTTEVYALAPRVPFIGPVGAFDTAIQKWSTANNTAHAFIEYDGQIAPQRQAPPQPDGASIREAMTAGDDIKSIIGIYDAGLGARSNETSGVAINARQRESDVSTFHFIDNLTRAIRHCGRILIDLIPKVYNQARIVRILGENMDPSNVQLAAGPEQVRALQEKAAAEGREISRIYDISAGKYDLTVKTGPTYSTQREQTRSELVEIMRAVPDSAQVLGPMYLRNSDWPGSDEAADKIEGKEPISQTPGQPGSPQGGPQVPPELMQQVQAMQAALQGGQQALQALQAENQTLKNDQQLKFVDVRLKEQEIAAKQQEVQVKAFEAETDRLRVQAEIARSTDPLRGVAGSEGI